ncbi:hypothetical protein ACAH01_07890 [Halomicrobium sp. HM KBTZ05]|uniref:hypothetical protein n=1 Tax=Halomicrobium sp. HM KBTZ05 TaxID=3242663 RepID=UPI003557E043
MTHVESLGVRPTDDESIRAFLQSRGVGVLGPIERVPERERDSIDDDLSDGWRPAVLEAAVSDGGTAVYRLDIERQDGFEQSGLPPGDANE